MSTRDAWIEEGLRILAEQGAPGVRTDRIAARLGLTKGSFHHHFAGAPDFRRAVLGAFEERSAAALAGVVAEATDRSPADALALLGERATDLLDQPLETAVRAWAFQDDDARAAMARVDRARYEALEAMWTGLVDDPADARTAALLPHLVVIGATMALPAIDRADLSRLFDLLVRLVPYTDAEFGGTTAD
ncbi:TetR/AcrR family transcriptional regulator [Agromyces sp. LHK192]|uniref:TetR/AcrR family transcriptional regulator n=1 Tax=Agromyces sp. LHK192 TaxID=2498704 RepID=UPI000FDB5A6B|nr:TetR/AcrR family transcriptional regulator [Agromyces sp. LHK192]